MKAMPGKNTLAYLRTRIGVASFIVLNSLILEPAKLPAAEPNHTEIWKADSLQAFFDGIIPPLMSKLHVPGVVLAVVRGDEIAYLGGYGYANVKKQIAASPGSSMFRVASVSKVLTVTAVMQLVEKGLLDLTVDINTYIDKFKVPATFEQPITLAHLITHTAGFDDTRIGLATLSESNLTSLGDYLAGNLPPRVMPPGREYSYSRFGIALAGYIVEAVSGVPFYEYVNRNILQPLNMRRSSFRHPVDFGEDVAIGYHYSGGHYEEVPYYYFFTYPEASFSTCAEDMARFMLAHLQDGKYRRTSILKPATLQLMHRQKFTHHPALPGLAYGFYERLENGHQAIQHGGHIPGFVSRLILMPESSTGFFIVCNHDRFKLISDVTSAFFDRYFPKRAADSNLLASNGNGTVPDGAFELKSLDLRPFAGIYRINEYSRTTLEKIFSLRKQFKIEAGEHELWVNGKDKLVPVDSLVFRNVASGELSAFGLDKEHKVWRWYDKRCAYEKLSIFEGAMFQLGGLALMGLVFTSGLLLWAGRSVPAIRLRWLHDRIESNGVFRLAGVVSLLNLTFMAGLGFLFVTFDRIDQFTFGLAPWIIGLLCLPMASTVLTLGLITAGVQVSTSKAFSRDSRLYFALLTITSVVFLVYLNYWNLLGFHL